MAAFSTPEDQQTFIQFLLDVGSRHISRGTVLSQRIASSCAVILSSLASTLPKESQICQFITEAQWGVSEALLTLEAKPPSEQCNIINRAMFGCSIRSSAQVGQQQVAVLSRLVREGGANVQQILTILSNSHEFSDEFLLKCATQYCSPESRELGAACCRIISNGFSSTLSESTALECLRAALAVARSHIGDSTVFAAVCSVLDKAGGLRFASPQNQTEFTRCIRELCASLFDTTCPARVFAAAAAFAQFARFSDLSLEMLLSEQAMQWVVSLLSDSAAEGSSKAAPLLIKKPSCNTLLKVLQDHGEERAAAEGPRENGATSSNRKRKRSDAEEQIARMGDTIDSLLSRSSVADLVPAMGCIERLHRLLDDLLHRVKEEPNQEVTIITD